MKTKRLREMSELEQALIMSLWKAIQDKPVYVIWQNYEAKFEFEGQKYNYNCEFLVENGHLQIRNPRIEREQVVIELLH